MGAFIGYNAIAGQIEECAHSEIPLGMAERAQGLSNGSSISTETHADDVNGLIIRP
ncbi:protein phosphatase methylesterase 1 [Edwardsiella piscicida]|nr:protein phosphatase methylesterase 1 [Edwardsiella piscicida]